MANHHHSWYVVFMDALDTSHPEDGTAQMDNSSRVAPGEQCHLALPLKYHGRFTTAGSQSLSMPTEVVKSTRHVWKCGSECDWACVLLFASVASVYVHARIGVTECLYLCAWCLRVSLCMCVNVCVDVLCLPVCMWLGCECVCMWLNVSFSELRSVQVSKLQVASSYFLPCDFL